MISNQYISIEGISLNYSKFKGEESVEYQWIITAQRGTTFDQQLQQIEEQSLLFLKQKGLDAGDVVFRRYFFSDISNQAGDTERFYTTFHSPISMIQQPPASGHKVAAWFTAVKFADKATRKGTKQSLTIEHNGYKHHYVGTLQSAMERDSEAQSREIFEEYSSKLEQQGLTLQDNCIRTWLYVRDIDNNYHGMVVARNKAFAKCGLTPNTHFIASTGIEGQALNTRSLVSMDAYAVGGLADGQIRYIKALSHLNPTHEYGVAFERATAVDYGDVRQVFVSGTASINNKGEIVFANDIAKQIERTIENIAALLAEADTSLEDLASMIVYLRDSADYGFVENYLMKHFASTPFVIVRAPVCRYGWLVEIEGMAIKHVKNPQLRNF